MTHRSLGPALALVLLAACASRAPAARSAGGEASDTTILSGDVHRACESPTDCVVLPRTCCGRCGAATPGDAVALSAAWLRDAAAEGRRVCEGAESCVDCFEETAPTLVATCRDHLCTLVELDRSELTACRTDADCALTHAGCCACGSRQSIALGRGSEDAYRTLICGEVPLPCPECVGRPILGSAACVAGHCALAEETP